MADYRLQALLELRERAEEQAKEVFAQATQALRAEQDRLQELKDELQAMIEDRHRRRDEYARKLACGEMRVSDQAGAYRFLDRMKEAEGEQRAAIDAQQEAVEDAERYLRETQDALIAATQDLKALLKHKESWQTERKRVRAQKEADQLDEIAQTIYQQQQRGRR